MKKIFTLLALVITISSSAQINKEWLTNHKEAISKAESVDSNILIFAFDNSNSETSKILESELFNSEEFEAIQSNFVFLKLNVNADDYSKRLAAHYSGVKTFPTVALIDKRGNPIGQSLQVINPENIKKFISFLKENI